MADIDYTLVFEGVTAVATLAVPIVVAVMAGRFNDQLRKWEAGQWRNQELIKARLEYYKLLIPKMNDLMCYYTFIGAWKDLTPPQVIDIKRTLDREFHCAVPLFSDGVHEAYDQFMSVCFETFGAWGQNAKLRTGYGRRKEAAGADWDPDWEPMFSLAAGDDITRQSLTDVRKRYETLMSAFAGDIELNVARGRYVTADVTAGAH
ncbi:MAG: hypothetical protein ACM30G_10185 [Micromonosporaceae bacterium]